MDHWNNYLFAISIFLLIGKDSRKEDLEYLGGPVIDCAGRPFEYDLVRNRIENSIQMINSVSFNEFARMLKVLPANIYLKDANGRYVFSSQTCGVRNNATKERYVKLLDFREGNEESSEKTTGCKASVYAEFDDCPRAEKFVKLLSFRHFERHMLFS